MRKFTLAGAAVLVCAVLASVAIGGDTDKQADITNKIGNFVKAWNNHDAKAMAEFWDKGGDLIDPTGKVARGKPEVQQYLENKHKEAFRNATLTMSTESLKMIDDHAAVVDATCHLSGVVGPDGKTMDMPDHHVVFVMHEDWGWRFADVRVYFFTPEEKK